MTPPLTPAGRIIVAADVSELDSYRTLLESLSGTGVMVKVGLELITLFGGPCVVRMAHDLGLPVMYDGKFNDIPNTMAAASRAVAEQGVELFTVHASAGPASLCAATGHAGNSLVAGVTILTSLDEKQARDVFGLLPDAKAMNFAQDLLTAKAHAVICSPMEAHLLRAGTSFRFNALQVIAPGIRPLWAENKHDQKRVMTPSEALKAGVDRLVIGRPITQYPGGPKEAIQRLVEEIAEATA